MGNLLQIKTLILLLLLGACSQAQDTDGRDLEGNRDDVIKEEPVNTCLLQNEVAIEDRWGNINCVDFTSENICLRDDFGFSQTLGLENQQVFESCMIMPGLSQTNSKGLSIRPPRISMEVSQTQKREFARWADKNKHQLTNLPQYYTSRNFGSILMVGKNVPEMFFLGVLDPSPMEIEPTINIFAPKAPLIFEKVKDLIAFMENKKQTFSTNDQSIKELIALNDRGKPETKIIENYTQNFCAESCVKESKPMAVSQGLAVFREYFSYGVRFRSEWIVEDDNQQVVAMLYMQNDKPSLAVKIKRDKQGFPILVEIRNSRNKKVYTTTWKAPDIKKERRALKFESSVNLPKVALCEAQLNPIVFQKNHMGSKVLKGSSTSSSFYGWQDGFISDLDSYFSGRLNMNRLGLPMDWGYSLANHSQEVAGTLAEKEPIGIIPLGMNSCLSPERAWDWWSGFEYTEAKVVNLSIRNFGDEKTCIENMKKHPMLKKPHGALWVIAAGNQGKKRATGCPQYLSGLENVLVVGASEGSRVHKNSNRGSDFVDLFTDGDSASGQDWGTSHSAPRVARLAAKIFHEYPELRVEDVKAAIMLSVNLQYTKLPSRSGGTLNSVEAMALAELILEENGDLESVVRKRYCDFGCGSQYRKRMKILKRLGGQ